MMITDEAEKGSVKQDEGAVKAGDKVRRYMTREFQVTTLYVAVIYTQTIPNPCSCASVSKRASLERVRQRPVYVC